MVVSQQTVEPLVALNATVSLADVLTGIDEPVCEPLVISFAVVAAQAGLNSIAELLHR